MGQEKLLTGGLQGMKSGNHAQAREETATGAGGREQMLVQAGQDTHRV